MNRDLLSGEYKRFPKHWDVIPFTKAFKDMTGGQTKIPKGDYLERGDIPIIDQGQDLIGGYTNEYQAVCDIRLPCVLFGDHTKIFKFVTKPFALGADGVKVLSEANNIDPKFAYYFLNTLNLPDVGYSRHFRFLKRTFFPLPPLEEQRRIAAILDKADGVRRKRKEAIRLTEELLKSTFLEMFGYSSDESVSIGELLDKGVLLLHKDGNHGSNYPRTSEFGIEGIPFLSANCFSDSGEMITDNVKFLSESKANKLKIGWLEHSDVLLAHNATVGRVALYDGRYKQALVGTSLTIFRPHREYLLPEFLFGVLRSEMFQKQLAHNMEQSTRNQVPITAQRDLKIKLAPLKKQLKFKELFHHVMNISKKYESSNQESENLFNSLLQKAFRGEL